MILLACDRVFSELVQVYPDSVLEWFGTLQYTSWFSRSESWLLLSFDVSGSQNIRTTSVLFSFTRTEVSFPVSPARRIYILDIPILWVNTIRCPFSSPVWSHHRKRLLVFLATPRIAYQPFGEYTRIPVDTTSITFLCDVHVTTSMR